MKKRILSILLVLVMVLALVPISAFTASAVNAVWWANPSDPTNFKVEFDSDLISSNGWCKLFYSNEETDNRYVQVSGSKGCRYVGTSTVLDFEMAIRKNGPAKYKLQISMPSGALYETAERTVEFTGELDAPKNLRWDGMIARWDPVEGADQYDVTVQFMPKDEDRYRIWVEALSRGNTCYVDFSESLLYEGTYYFQLEAVSTDEMLAGSYAASPEITVEYNKEDVDAHFGKTYNNERKYTLYVGYTEDATGYYLSVLKKNGDEYQPISGVGGKLGNIGYYDLYKTFESNGAGDYRVEIFAFNTDIAIPVSNDTVFDITFTPCEHDFSKRTDLRAYLANAGSDCTEAEEFYYACQYCCEMAPKEEQYVYVGGKGEHDMIEEYQASGTQHWHGCSKCDYVEHIQTHTLDENNYCATCDTTVYEVWVGDTQITSKNCDDLFGDGSVFYMPELNRLFLTNYTDPASRREGITVIDPDNGNDYVAMIYAKNGLNLHFRGENFLYEDAGDIGRQYAVVVENGDLKIEGSGSLYTDATVGFYTMDGDIYIDKNGGLLEVAAGRYAFSCEYHKLYINDGKVKARSYVGHVYTSAPVLDNYYGCYYAEIADNYDMNNPKPFEKTTNVKYFYIESARMVTINPAEGEGETILQIVRKGQKYTLPECPYTAPAGKQFYRWYLDSWTKKGEEVVGETFTITEDITITPVWTDKTLYTITATAGEHGWITPEGEVSVIEGENQRFTISADAGNGYCIKDIKVNGVSVGTDTTYIFENVTSDATIEAEFMLSGLELKAKYNGTVLAGNKINPDDIRITTNYVTNPMKNEPVNAGEVEYCYNGVKITDPVNYVFGADLIGDVNITVKYEGLEATMTVKVVGHEITFGANGGSGTMEKAQYVGVYTLPSCSFTAPEGKQFKGWATSEDGAVLEGATIDITEPIELFAIWEDIPVHTHSHGSDWKFNADNHWNQCECGDKANVAPHADTNNDEKCDVCGYAMPKADDPAPTPDKDPDKESDKETDKVTDKNDETDKDDEDEKDASAEKGGCGGCGSSAALSALAIVCAVGTALVIKKKED